MNDHQHDDGLQSKWAEHLKTINGPMLYRSGVKDPQLPTDATHVGPVGDMWRIDLDDKAHRATAYAWDGETWFLNDQQFVHGLLDLGITFTSICDLKDLSAELMLTDLAHRAARGTLPAQYHGPLASTIQRYRASKASQN